MSGPGVLNTIASYVPPPATRTLSEQEYNTIRDHVLKTAPDGLNEADFQRYIGPALQQALGEAENRAPTLSEGMRNVAAGAWGALKHAHPFQAYGPSAGPADPGAGYDDPNKSILRQQVEHGLDAVRGAFRNSDTMQRAVGAVAGPAIVGAGGQVSATPAFGVLRVPAGETASTIAEHLPNRFAGTDLTTLKKALGKGGQALASDDARLARVGVSRYGTPAKGPTIQDFSTQATPEGIIAQPSAADEVDHAFSVKSRSSGDRGAPPTSSTVPEASGGAQLPPRPPLESSARPYHNTAEQENIDNGSHFGMGHILPDPPAARPSELRDDFVEGVLSPGPSELTRKFLLDQMQKDIEARAAVRGTPADIPNNPVAQALEAERQAASQSAAAGRPAKLPVEGNVPASKSRRSPASATPGLTVTDVEELGLNPTLPIKELTPELLDRIQTNRARRAALYRAAAELDKKP